MSGRGVVLLAVFRPDASLLRRQVMSLREQTLREWQCLVGIDGEDPDAYALLMNLVEGDPRFRLIHYTENIGHYRNFERLTSEVPRGAAWIAYCDQDDYWYPAKLEKLASLLQDKQTSAAVASARVVNRHGISLGIARRKAGPLSQLLLKNEVTGCCAMFRPEVAELALPFPEAVDSSVHDHWLAVCAAATGDVRFSDHPLQDYVQHGANAIGEPPVPTLRSHIDAIRRDGGLSGHLHTISRVRWGWRVSMARAILPRLDEVQRRRLPSVQSVARGQISPKLIRQLGAEVTARRISLRDGISMGIAALWWRQARKDL